MQALISLPVQARCYCVPGFGEYSKKRYIPRTCVDLFEFLAGECNADQARCRVALASRVVRERAIVIATSHTNSVAASVECDERNDHKIELYKRTGNAVDGLKNAD